MKKKVDPRHRRRQLAIKELFAQSFIKHNKLPRAKSPRYSRPSDSLVLAKSVIKGQEQINKIIKKTAPVWPIEQINKIDLAILQLAIYELEKGREPVKVIIDEAIELAKEFGSESSSAFVNGVLAKIIEEKNLD